jgi:hypothetical protein
VLLGLFYCYKPVLTNLDGFLNNLDALLVEFNKALVFIGLGTSLSTLQDTTKVQNKFSQRIYDNPRKTKFFLWIIGHSNCHLPYAWLNWTFWFDQVFARTCLRTNSIGRWVCWNAKVSHRNGRLSAQKAAPV